MELKTLIITNWRKAIEVYCKIKYPFNNSLYVARVEMVANKKENQTRQLNYDFNNNFIVKNRYLTQKELNEMFFIINVTKTVSHYFSTVDIKEISKSEQMFKTTDKLIKQSHKELKEIEDKLNK